MALSMLTAQGEVAELSFSRSRCFEQGVGAGEQEFLSQAADHLDVLTRGEGSLVLYGAGDLCRLILDHEPRIRAATRCVVDDDPARRGASMSGVPVSPVEALPGDTRAVLLCSRRWSSLRQMRSRLPEGVRAVDLDEIAEAAPQAVPRRAWVKKLESIYPMEVPKLRFEAGMDMILLDLPGRYANEMPVGLAYVHNALEATGIRHQTVDAGMILYHRFHTRRILDGERNMTTAEGYRVVADPWLAENSDQWREAKFLRFFHEEMDEIVAGLAAARPKIVGLSLHLNNLAFAREVVRRLQESLPEVVIVAGGMACSRHDVAREACPGADFICVGEADMTVGPLVERIVNGERPADLPGVLSRYDSKDRAWQDAPVAQDLDSLDPPRFPWADVRLYRTWNDDTVIPLVASRGCHWGRCRFCNEPYGFRGRSADSVVDEIEWFCRQGFDHFVFHDSDCNGDPENLVQMCREINRRGLEVRISGQMRIRKTGTPEFFRELRRGGFDYIRFGVDGWSRHTLKLQRKGYSKSMITANLKSCTEAGICVDVNCVVGVPGETEEDVDEAIAFMIENSPWYNKMAYLHSLMMFIGSEYWKEPQQHGIVIREHAEAEETADCSDFICRLPDHLWYSTDPLIDEQTKLARLQRVFEALRQADVEVSDYAIRHMEVEQQKRRGGVEAGQPQPDASEHEGRYLPFFDDGLTLGVVLDEAFEVVEHRVSYRGHGAPLLLGCHKGHRLVVFRDRVYGVPLTMPDVDLTRYEHVNMLGVFCAANPAQVIDVIDRMAQGPTGYGATTQVQGHDAPFVVEKDYKGFLIYASKDRIVGLDASMDMADLPRLSEQQLIRCMQQRLIHSAPSLELVLGAIDQAAIRQRSVNL